MSIRIDFLERICYVVKMVDDFIEKAKRYLRVGSIVMLILSILISILINYLLKFSFICFDPDLCKKSSEPLVVIPPRPK